MPTKIALPKVLTVEKDAILKQLCKLYPRYVSTTVDFRNELFQEYLKFMVIQATNSSPSTIQYCPSPPIDDVWHSHILCTREYANFCAKLGRGIFIHHTPSDGITSDYLNFRNTIQRYSELGFGDTQLHAECWKGNSVLNTCATAEGVSTDRSEETIHHGKEKRCIIILDDDETPAKKGKTDRSFESKPADAAIGNRTNPIHAKLTTLIKQLPPGDPNRPPRHLRAFIGLVQDGIASATKAYSERNENGTYTFIGFKKQITYGPGSTKNSLLFCTRCDNVWHYMQDDANDNRYKRFNFSDWVDEGDENDSTDESEEKDSADESSEEEENDSDEEDDKEESSAEDNREEEEDSDTEDENMTRHRMDLMAAPMFENVKGCILPLCDTRLIDDGRHCVYCRSKKIHFAIECFGCG